MPITGFTVEPAGYSPLMARLSSGLVSLLLSSAHSARGDAAAEHARIEARQAHERQHIAGVRIDGHRRAAPAGEGFFGGLLRGAGPATVMMSMPARGLRLRSVLSRLLRPCTERPCALTSISLEAIHAMQFGLARRFHAQLAHQRGAFVGVEVDLLAILLGDGAHVAQCMHGQRAIGVEARGARLHFHAREFVAMHGEGRHLLLGQAQPDGHGLEGAIAEHLARQVRHVLRRNGADARQARQRAVQVLGRAHLSRAPVPAGRKAGSPPAPCHCGPGSGRGWPGSARCARGCLRPGRCRSRSAPPAAAPAGPAAPASAPRITNAATALRWKNERCSPLVVLDAYAALPCSP